MGLISNITDDLGLTNTREQERAARGASEAQVARSREAMDIIGGAQAGALQRLDPMVNQGNYALRRAGALSGQDIKPTMNPLLFGQYASGYLADDVDPLGQGQYMGGMGQALGADTSLDPNVLNSPFFQALQEESTRNLERSAAARGRVGAGGTADAIARQSMLLGSQFAQQDLQNRMGVQGTRFNQLMQRTGTLLGAQGQRFGQQAGLAQLQAGLRGQDASMLSNVLQSNFAQQMGNRQQRSSELMNLANLGAQARTNQSNIIQSTAANQGNLLTGIGNAQAAGMIGAANVQNPLISSLMGAGAGAGLGAAGMLGEVGAGGGALLGLLSDQRMKEDIKRVGYTDDGLPIYTYKYKGRDGVHMGVMAQELEKLNPDAVHEHKGFKYVNYGAI